jgi:flavin-dependent dehydrogenase
MTSTPDFDVLVVGGGPAGLATAIRAAQHGLGVGLLEPKSAPIDKACGEGLMPSALERLVELGIDPDALPGHEFRGIRYCDAVDADLSAQADFPGGVGRGVRRVVLHERLSDRLRELDVARIPRRVSTVSQDSSGVMAAGLRARYLVAADGLHSTVRDALGLTTAKRRRSRYGIRRHFRAKPWTSRVEVHWADDAEAYVTPVGPDLVGVAMLFHGQGRFDPLMQKFPRLQERLGDAEPVTRARGSGPFAQLSRRRVDGRVLLVGDAAGYVDPLTGEGVAMAVDTSAAAVEAILDGAPARYENDWWRLTRRYFWLTEALYRLTRIRRVHRPMIRLLDAVPPVFRGALGLIGGR